MKYLDDPLITTSDFLKSTGINLDLELPNDDDEGNKASRFILQTQNFIIQTLFSYENCELNDNNLPFFKRALIAQIKYALINTNDKLSDVARQILRQGGFLNIKRWDFYG